MKVVLDTNVLVSALYFGGTPARILGAWSDGRFVMLASLEILAKYGRVVDRLELQHPSVGARRILNLIVRECRIIDAPPAPTTACDDPDDVKGLACALAGGATCVVSGDRALLRASGFEGVEVVTPRTFAVRNL